MNKEKYFLKREYKIYAVDFDGCLTFNKEIEPKLGLPNMDLINFLIREREMGNKVILWTCREDNTRIGNLLTEAVEFCRGFGLEFDAINKSTQEIIDFYGVDSRKVTADYYIDDKAIELPTMERMVFESKVRNGDINPKELLRQECQNLMNKADELTEFSRYVYECSDAICQPSFERGINCPSNYSALSKNKKLIDKLNSLCSSGSDFSCDECWKMALNGAYGKTIDGDDIVKDIISHVKRNIELCENGKIDEKDVMLWCEHDVKGIIEDFIRENKMQLAL